MISRDDIDYIDNRIDLSRFERSTILVSGATGFIGRNLVRYFLEHGKVVALCRSEKKARVVFSDYIGYPNIKFYYGDLCDSIVIDEDIDYIFHTASPSSTNLIKKIPFDVGVCNTVGTYQLLSLGLRKNIKGFLYTSSGAVYGAEKDEGGGINESEYFAIDSLNPSNCYSLSKKMGENLCVGFASQYHIHANIVRISHTYGPGIDIYDGHIYSDFVRNILEGKDLVIHGDGRSKRPFCYISDAIVAFCLIILSGCYGEAYNMANNSQTVTIEELASILCNRAFPERTISYKILGRSEIRPVCKECWTETGKLERLGWRPQIDIVEGFKKTVAFEEAKRMKR